MCTFAKDFILLHIAPSVSLSVFPPTNVSPCVSQCVCLCVSLPCLCPPCIGSVSPLYRLCVRLCLCVPLSVSAFYRRLPLLSQRKPPPDPDCGLWPHFKLPLQCNPQNDQLFMTTNIFQEKLESERKGDGGHANFPAMPKCSARETQKGAFYEKKNWTVDDRGLWLYQLQMLR